MAEYMRYAGEAVEIFAWTPARKPVPRLRSHVLGESVGDHAFVDERAMYWDGGSWLPLLWKDYAVWTKTDAEPKRRASDVEDDYYIDLDEARRTPDQIALDNLPPTTRIRDRVH